MTDPSETIDALAAEVDDLRAELAAAKAKLVRKTEALISMEAQRDSANEFLSEDRATLCSLLRTITLIREAGGWTKEDLDALPNVVKVMRQQRDEATAWRPIDTAPMNGTRVMLYGDGRVTVGSWIREREVMASTYHHTTGVYLGSFPSGDIEPAYWESHDGGFTEEHPPTHWMPLPQPPREKQGGGA